MDYFIFKGIDSRTIKNLVVTSLPPISKPEMKVENIEIDGRDGDIITELGYKSYEKVIKMFALDNIDIDYVVSWLKGEGKLIISNESDKYYNARVISKIDIERLIKYKEIEVEFHIQPFKYLINEDIVTFNGISDNKTGNNIHLTDSSNNPINKLKVKGYTKQEVRSGKNIFNVRSRVSNNVDVFSISDDDYIHYVNSSGTVQTVGFSKMIVEPSTTYYLSFEISNNGNGKKALIIDTYDTNNTKIKTQYAASSQAITTDSSAKYIQITLTTQNTSTIDDFTIRLQFEKGSSFTGYEKYGATPTPDYPSEIDVVEGNSEGKLEVKSVNKNILDYTKATVSISGTNRTFIDNGVNVKGTNGWSQVKIPFTAEIGKTYYIKCDFINYNDTKIRANINNSYDGPLYTTSSGTMSFNYTPTKTDNYILLVANYSGSALNSDVDFTNIIISDIDTPYEPHQENSVIYNLKQDNLFDGQLELGTFDANGYIATSSNCVRTKNYIEVKPNSIYSIFSDLNYQAVIQFYDSSMTLIKAVGFTNRSFTTPEATKYIKWRSSVNNKENNLNVKYSLYEYMPNSDGTNFMAEDDYIEDSVLNKEWGKVVLDGSDDEIYSKVTSGSNENYIQINSNLGLSNIDKSVSGSKLKCTRFEYYSDATVPSKSKAGIRIYDSITNFVFSIPTTIATDVATFRTWLSNNPIEVYYKLATPYKVQLKQTGELKTYKNVSNISNSEDADMDIQYYKNCELEVINQGYENSKPIIEIDADGQVSVYTNDMQNCNLELDNEKIILDSLEEDAYYDITLKNNKMSGEFPIIKPGTNKISLEGKVKELKIDPKSRWL